MHTVSVSLIKSVLRNAALVGVDRKQLLACVQLSESDLNDPEQQVDCGKKGEILAAAAELSGDRDFHLHQAEQFDPAQLNVIGYLLANSPTVREAYQKSIQYSRIIGNGLDCTLAEVENEAIITVEILSPALEDYRRLIIESNFVTHVSALRNLTGRPASPKAIYFRHQAPADRGELKRIFKCDLQFGAENNRIIYRRSLMDVKISQSNPGLYQMLTGYADAILGKLNQGETITRKVSKLVMELMMLNEVSLEAVAERLAIGPRTLQRQLREEETTFNHILSSVRKEIAIRHLQEGAMSISEISYRLGFSEPSVFHRSFKKWTGRTPRQFLKLETMV